jgi:hypothetical protein
MLIDHACRFSLMTEELLEATEAQRITEATIVACRPWVKVSGPIAF